MVWGRPSMWSGSPTTSPSGFQVETIPSMESQSGSPSRTFTVESGLAVPVTDCPTATPMRRSP